MRLLIVSCLLMLTACFHDENEPADTQPESFVLTLDVATNGERHGPIENIVLTSSRTLDPASSAEVQLIAPGNIAVPFDVSITDKSLVVNPRIALQPGLRYTLTVSGLQDFEGENLAEPFTTDVNVSLTYIEREEFFSTSNPRLEVTTFSADDLPSRKITYSDPGFDGEWDTGDETVRDYTEFEYPAPGREIQRRYNDPGDDATWFNEDDQLAYITHKGTASDGQDWYSVGITNPGADNTWETEDDRIAWGVTHAYDGSGRRIVTAWLYGLGADILPDTEDDLISQVVERRYEEESPGLVITYEGPGEDGDWTLTADNDIEDYYRWQTASDGSRISLHYEGAGADGEWLTGEDDVRDTWLYERKWQQDGWQLYGLFWDSDGVPLSGDEKLDVFEFEKLDEHGEQAASGIVYWAGDDGTAFTPDDELLQFSSTERDSDGLAIATTVYQTLGADYLPLTGDEPLSARSRSTHDALGNVTGNEFIDKPGSDGEWNTPDDHVYVRYTYRSYHGK